MQEQLITFETAKLAKEKGFDIFKDCYSEKGELIPLREQVAKVELCKYPAPTQSLLQKWLREVHHLHIEVRRDEDEWKPELYEISHGNKHTPTGFKTYRTYEDALEIGLQEALKLIKIK